MWCSSSTLIIQLVSQHCKETNHFITEVTRILFKNTEYFFGGCFVSAMVSGHVLCAVLAETTFTTFIQRLIFSLFLNFKVAQADLLSSNSTLISPFSFLWSSSYLVFSSRATFVFSTIPFNISFIWHHILSLFFQGLNFYLYVL